MLGAPDLLILDEPTDGLDPVGRVEVRKLLLEEKARGATLLLNAPMPPPKYGVQTSQREAKRYAASPLIAKSVPPSPKPISMFG
jgi:ABC-type transport system involved in cytochrome c biogenesis ATPase subunit